MTTQLTLELSEDVLRRAATIASATQRDVTEVLQEALTLTFGSAGEASAQPTPVTELSDAEVVALCDSHLPDAEAARLTQLLDRRQEGVPDPAPTAEMAALIQSYQSRWLRQSEALAEAVRRGLRAPMHP